MITEEQSPDEREKHEEEKSDYDAGEETAPFSILNPDAQETPDARKEIKLQGEIKSQKKKEDKDRSRKIHTKRVIYRRKKRHTTLRG